MEPLGEGSMATVYAGEHVVLGHRVAIKIMHPEYMRDPHMERRLLREARALAAIRHPGIVQLVDIGRGPGGRAYIIMELLEGETLADRLRGGALPERQTLHFGRQIASALAAAHAHDIVHRDLKPENVFIVDDPAVPLGERAKIIDFGIAKRAPVVHLTPTPRITRIGVVVGTPEYMSPEQCAGDDVDARSDVYSLGVVLYQMATGSLPFAGSTGEVIAHHRYVESPRPKTLVSDISAPLDELISRCLAKRAEGRYRSMEDVVEALHCMDGDTALPPPEREPDTGLYRLDGRTAEPEPDSGLFQLVDGEPLDDEPEPPTNEVRFEDVVVEVDETYDVPPPRGDSRFVAYLGAAVVAAVLAVGGFLLWDRGEPNTEPDTEPIAAPEPAPDPAPEPAPEPAPAPAAAPAAAPAPTREPPPPKVASLETRAERPRSAKKAERKPERKSERRAERKRRRRPPPDKPKRPDPPEEKTFTDVVTPTVF